MENIKTAFEFRGGKEVTDPKHLLDKINKKLGLNLTLENLPHQWDFDKHEMYTSVATIYTSFNEDGLLKDGPFEVCAIRENGKEVYEISDITYNKNGKKIRFSRVRELLAKELIQISRELFADPAPNPEQKVTFDGDGFSSSLKKDVKTKKGKFFSKGDKIKLYWNEKRYSYTWVKMSDDSMLVLPTAWLYDYANGVIKRPSDTALYKWEEDGYCKSVLGKRVEPDGTDPDGAPSWLLVESMI